MSLEDNLGSSLQKKKLKTCKIDRLKISQGDILKKEK